MDSSDVDKGIEIATKMLSNNLEVQMELQDEPMFIKRIAGTFKTKDGKDCRIIIYVGIMNDIKDLRIIARGVKNLAIIREIPLDDFEESIRGPGIAAREI